MQFSVICSVLERNMWSVLTTLRVDYKLVPGRDAGGIETGEVSRISRLVQKSAMLPWLRWQQQFDLPMPDSLSKL